MRRVTVVPGATTKGANVLIRTPSGFFSSSAARAMPAMIVSAIIDVLTACTRLQRRI
jgi:hypothetical protein